MSKKLWQPSLIVKKNSNLFAFENYISKKLKIKFNRNYKKLLNWSIKNSPEFWSRFWDFSKIIGTKGKKKFRKSKTFYKNTFCLLYTSPSPRDQRGSRMPSSA